MKHIGKKTIAAVLCIAQVGLSGCVGGASISAPLSQAVSAYQKALDKNYAAAVADEISGYKSNEQAGFRTSGSQAESDAGEYIRQQMEAVGLTGVEKKSFDVDIWSFEKGTLSYKSAEGQSYYFNIAAYQTTMETEGVKYFDMLYAPNTDIDVLQKMNLKGKFLLVDTKKSELRYVAYQANLLGAAGVLAVNDTGADTLSVDNIRGSAEAPVLVIAPKDADVLKSAIQKANYIAPAKKSKTATYTSDKSITVGLDVSSRVTSGGVSLNVVGSIPGIHADELLLVSASYDGFFGAYSNSSAVGMMLSMAKAMIKSGYKPDKTIVFIAQAADAWNARGSNYDWGQGGYSQIYQFNPEWVGKAVADIHMDAPAYDFGDQYPLRCSYELSSFISEAVSGTTGDAYPGGVSVKSLRSTQTGDFSYSIAGIPTVGVDLSAGGFPLVINSTADNKSRYSENAMLFSLQLYGKLLMRFDRTAVSPLDFSPLLAALKSSYQVDALKAAGISEERLTSVIDKASEQAVLLKVAVWQKNSAYAQAIENQDKGDASAVYKQTRQLNADVLALYKRAQALLTRIDINGEAVFPHQRSQTDTLSLTAALAALNAGKASAGLASLKQIDSNALFLSVHEKVVDFFDNQLGTQEKNESKWSLFLIEDQLDLRTVIRSVESKTAQAKLTSAGLAAEIVALKSAQISENTLFSNEVESEIIGLGIMTNEIAAALASINK